MGGSEVMTSGVYRRTAETRKKLSARIISPETRQKLSKSLKESIRLGRRKPPSFKGCHHTAETKERIRIAVSKFRAKSAKTKPIKIAGLGKPHPQKQRQKRKVMKPRKHRRKDLGLKPLPWMDASKMSEAIPKWMQTYYSIDSGEFVL